MTQLGAHVSAGQRPAEQSTRAGGEDAGHVQPADPGRDVGDVAGPQLVQLVAAEASVREVIGRTSIWELLPECVAAVAPVPVLASGGIGDGASIARALSLGAQGVSLGTTFLAAEEADIHPAYRQRVLGANASDTFLTDDLFDVGWPEAPHRTLRSTTFEQWDLPVALTRGNGPMSTSRSVDSGRPAMPRWRAMRRSWRPRRSTATSKPHRSGPANPSARSTSRRPQPPSSDDWHARPTPPSHPTEQRPHERRPRTGPRPPSPP